MTIMPAHWLTVLVIAFTVLITPFYWFHALPRSKAIVLAWITAVAAAVLATVTLFDVPGRLGPLGGALIGLMWIVPPAIAWAKRGWFGELDQKPLVALQIFRVIGGLFIVEMVRGHIPGSFALPAGIGDLVVGLLALALVLAFKRVPRWGVVSVLVLGVLDFISAFFFGFTSFEGPAQLFAVGFENRANLFPTGLIPIFLVPYAITFHVLSFATLRRAE
jgi:hypothetical protein